MNSLVTVKRPNKILNFLLRTIRDNKLLLLILLSIIVGFGIGIGIKNSSLDKDDMLWFVLPGTLFIRALEMLIVPVVFIGVVAATSSLSAKSNLKVTLICVGLTFLTHILATLCGLIGAIIVNALSLRNEQSTVTNLNIEKQKSTYDIIADILRSLVPKNIIKAATNQEITRYVLNENRTEYKRTVVYIDGTNILGILIFALLIGIATSVLDEKAKLFRDFFKNANDVVILVLSWIILLAPIGIASLIIEAIIEIDDLGESFKRIGLFAGICVAVLIFYGTVVLSLMIFVFTRKNPLKYYYYFLDPMLLAFASTSGAVCISKNLDICEHKVKMDPRLSRFTIPFYTTIQADGSSIFIVMSCGFLATYQNISLTIGDYIVIIIMTSILCLCLPSVPSASIVTILVVLNAINYSYLPIAILYTVEWLLDRVRTAVNLYSHCFCAVITYELCKKNLSKMIDDEESRTLEDEVNQKNAITSSISMKQMNTEAASF